MNTGPAPSSAVTVMLTVWRPWLPGNESDPEVEWRQLEWVGDGWNGMETDGMGWRRMEWNGDRWNELEWRQR